MSKRSITHVEIPAKHRDTLAGFYAEMFGWNFQHVPELAYTTFEAGNTRGGYPEVDQEHQPGDVLVYIDSEDIEADLKKIERLGGKTLTPRSPVGNRGWYAVFADPTGNKFGLWTRIKG
jgi:uncharacterized protein